MTWIDCEVENLEAIRALFNDAIANSTALYDYEPRTSAFMDEWFASKRRLGFPVIGMLDDDGTLMGFGSYGTFRGQAGFRWTVEHSLYLAADYRGRGLGRQLLEKLIQLATAEGHHLMIGVIDSDNHASIALHESLGFEACGRLHQAGFKFDRWLDVAFYQKIIS